MQELKANLWGFYRLPNSVVLITTNGTVKRDGTAVMGRGCALQAKHTFPGIDRVLGDLIKLNGNVVNQLRVGLWSFPVKRHWAEPASLELIRKSTLQLQQMVIPEARYYLPRPGCGNGQRTWEEVKPIVEVLPDNVYIVDFPTR